LFIAGLILWWREKMHTASTTAGCAEMPKFRKIEHFVHFGETGDSPDMLIFYFQHNKRQEFTPGISRKNAKSPRSQRV